MADKSDELAPEGPLEDLVRKVEQDAADPSVLQEPLQDESNWEHAEELGEIAKLTYLHLVAGDDENLCRRLRQKLKKIEEELGIARSGPLESLLVRRISLSWLQAHHADLLVVQAGPENREHAKYITRWQGQAHRRLMSASKTLAAVRKLLPRTAGD